MRENFNIDTPKDFDVVFNEKTQEWVLRPIKGFSEIHSDEITFIPSKERMKTEKKSTKNKNANLHSAKRLKDDEFYTTIDDIQNELSHYKKFFKDKVVYCPCDKVFNRGRSEFFNYFAALFQDLGLKKLICTQFNPAGNGSVIEIDKDIFKGKGLKWEYNGEYECLSHIDESKVNTFLLKGNGSFDSDECYKIMNEADIIVTNPPFSLFRNFVNQLVSLGKKFLIIGNKNAITYKEIFPLIKENKLWLGYYSPTNFKTPEEAITKKVNGLCRWFTNLEHDKRSEELYCGETYSEEKYPKYDNYDAIEVSKVCEIPKDYDGIMGVPITFLDNYNPSQFEIVGLDRYVEDNPHYGKRFTINNRETYARILIRKK
mgnify:CR=1 FL=1